MQDLEGNCILIELPFPHNRLERHKTTIDSLRKDTPCPGRNWDWGPHEYKSTAKPVDQSVIVMSFRCEGAHKIPWRGQVKILSLSLEATLQNCYLDSTCDWTNHENLRISQIPWSNSHSSSLFCIHWPSVCHFVFRTVSALRPFIS
jgi:hypothetical protein